MKNEIGRKITSLTLMTIMLAGGMTVAFPGFTPDAHAANANLIVSVENTGGNVAGPQVIEVLVIDPDIEDSTPTVTVNGAQLAMTKAIDGNFYAYIADEEAVTDIKNKLDTNPGLNFGTQTTCDLATTAQSPAPDTQAKSRVCTSDESNEGFNAVRSAETVVGNNNWPIIQLYDFTDDVDIQYQRAGGAQTSTFAYTDDASGLTLDRSVYPVAAQIHATITDHRLNIDPTSDDVWTWNTVDGAVYYMLDASNDYERDGNGVLTVDDNGNQIQFNVTANNAVPDVCSGCVLKIASDDVINSVDIDDRFYRASEGPQEKKEAAESIPEVQGVPGTAENPAGTPFEPEVPAVIGQPAKSATMWVTVTEDAPNAGTFTSTNNDNDSTLRVSDTAQRGASTTIEYDGDVQGIVIQHRVASIDIASPDDVWTSGLAIPIVIVDGDVNKNSRDSNDVDLTDPDSIIPTLVTNHPFTLSELSGDTWIGWDITDNSTAITLLNRAPDDSNNLSTYGAGNGPFILKGFNQVEDSDPATYENTVNKTNAAVLKNSATTASADRAVLQFYPQLEDVDDDVQETGDVDERQTNLTDLTNVAGTSPYANIDFLVIDLDGGVKALKDTLIEHGSSKKGHNFINYNVESLHEDIDVESIQVLVGGDVVDTISDLDGPSGYELAFTNTTALFAAAGSDKLQIKLNFDGVLDISENDGGEYPIVIDFFSFGIDNDGEASDERIANQIIRLLLEESGDDTASLEGTLEYVMINQLSITTPETYGSISPIGVDVSFVVIEDLTGSSAPSVTYLDVDTTGANTPVSAQQDAPSHSAVVTLNVDSFKTADTVTVTLEDLDLNTDSGLPDIYAVVTNDTDAAKNAEHTNRGAVGSPYTMASLLSDGSSLGRMLDITFDDQRWMTHTDDNGALCTKQLVDQDDKTGLDDTNFSLIETGDATGIFVGTFALPAEFCKENAKNPESITGLDIEVNYVDFRDASGETTEVGDSAGVKANTGSVSLDRTVYPVPFGVDKDFDQRIDATTPGEGNTDTRSLFPIHQSGMSDKADDGKTQRLDPGEYLPQGDLVVYVTVADPDFDVSASGKDSIAIDSCYTNPDNKRDRECKLTKEDGHTQKVDRSPVTLSVIRGSEDVTVARIGGSDSPIDEIAPDAGIFEKSVTIRYYDGPGSTLCPTTSIDDNTPNVNLNGRIGDHDNDRSTPDKWISSIDSRENYCILQGDILQVEYNDPTDASGQPNTVTDSATFDLRNGVLQSDKSVYIIGSDMILTLIEPDFDLDNSQNETYDLDLIKWSSSAATVTMGDAGGEIGEFDPEPLSFRETGPSTGIFQVVVEIPDVLDRSSLQRGEEIDLEYTDWGPSGSDYVGDQDEDIRLTVFTSNFGATINLDQKVYSWTDKVYITVVAPDHNFDNNLIDEIGESDEDPLRVATKGYDLDNYRLVETGFDTGIFTGEVILTGFRHDPTGDGNYVIPRTTGNGPTDGYLQTPSDSGISVSYEFSEDETVFSSSIIRWNIGDVQWLEASYPASATGVLRVIDPDMNLNPEAVDNFDVNIASNTDASGITLTVTETNEATGIFEGTIFFTTTSGSSGHRLRVSEGDTVTADYADGTLPLPYTVNDHVSITSTTIIGTIVPPLERAPATSLRIVDTFGSSIDAVSIDQQVQITADLSNGQDRDQDFAYLIQIQNSDGVTVSLSWIAGSLSPGQSFSPSASWTPTSADTYDVTAFVWESIDNPTALSPSLSIDVSVN